MKKNCYDTISIMHIRSAVLTDCTELMIPKSKALVINEVPLPIRLFPQTSLKRYLRRPCTLLLGTTQIKMHFENLGYAMKISIINF